MYFARVRTFIYGCAAYAEEEEVEKVRAMAGAGPRRALQNMFGDKGRGR